jgi:hypothetical protein
MLICLESSRFGLKRLRDYRQLAVKAAMRLREAQLEGHRHFLP